MTVARIATHVPDPAVIGTVVALVALAWLPAPLLDRVLLLAPARDRSRAGWPATARDSARLPAPDARPVFALTCALPLIGAVALPQSPLAGLLVVPWLLCCGTLAMAAAQNAIQRLRHPPRRWTAAEIALGVSPVYLLVGAAWLLIDRVGARSLDLTPAIVLLTAVHFHFAGFGLLSIAGLVASRRPSIAAWLAVLALTVGMPITAAGFTVDSTFLNWVGAITVAVGGLCVAGVLALALRDVRSARSVPAGVAVVALSVAMLLAITWATSVALQLDLLQIDTMVRTHGALNAIAVTLLAVLWPFADSP